MGSNTSPSYSELERCAQLVSRRSSEGRRLIHCNGMTTLTRTSFTKEMGQTVPSDNTERDQPLPKCSKVDQIIKGSMWLSPRIGKPYRCRAAQPSRDQCRPSSQYPCCFVERAGGGVDKWR